MLISLKLIKSSVLLEGIWRVHYYPEKNVAIVLGFCPPF